MSASLSQYSSACLARSPIRPFRFQHSPVSGFPLPCLNSCIPCFPRSSVRSLWGLPSSSTYLFLYATACGLRRTSYILTHNGCFVLASGTLKPWPSATSSSRSCTSFQGARSPLRPTGFSVYASPISCSQRLRRCSAMDARLDTGGWLALTRPGLSPSKIRQAYLGAVTLALSRLPTASAPVPLPHLQPECLFQFANGAREAYSPVRW